MDEFLEQKFEGKWWVAEELTTRFDGVLELDDRAHGYLTLKGTAGQFDGIQSRGPAEAACCATPFSATASSPSTVRAAFG